MSLKNIVIIGAGGLAREVKFLIDDINVKKPQYKFLGYIVSDVAKLGEHDSKEEVLGDLSWFDNLTVSTCVAIGIGTPKHRINLAREVRAHTKFAEFPVLIHPNAVYDSKSCIFDAGAVICANCVLTVHIHLKEVVFLNLACTVGHESVIGAGSVLNPTVNISGGVAIGEGVLVGTGAQVLQYLNVGDGAVVGAAACVTKDVPAGVTVVGIPAKPLNK